MSYGLIRKVWYREVWYGQSRRSGRGRAGSVSVRFGKAVLVSRGMFRLVTARQLNINK